MSLRTLQRGIGLLLGGLAVASTIMLAPPAASAAEPTYVVTVSTSFHVTDDDSSIFGASYTYASGNGPTQFAALGTDKNTGFLNTHYYNDRIRTVCAGNEVDGNLVTYISWQGGTTAYVALDLTLYEGDSCGSSDNDGVGHRAFFISPGQGAVSGSFTVRNYREGTNDRVIVYYTVTSQQV